MKLRHSIGIVCALAACSTTKNRPRAENCNVVTKAPACVVARIDQMCAGPRYPGEPMSVTRYAYRGQEVYYIPPHCCDIPSELLDAQCHVICYPDGGLTGRGDDKCGDFKATRSGGDVIWKE